jgi:hypothetical protein
VSLSVHETIQTVKRSLHMGLFSKSSSGQASSTVDDARERAEEAAQSRYYTEINEIVTKKRRPFTDSRRTVFFPSDYDEFFLRKKEIAVLPHWERKIHRREEWALVPLSEMESGTVTHSVMLPGGRQLFIVSNSKKESLLVSKSRILFTHEANEQQGLWLGVRKNN